MKYVLGDSILKNNDKGNNGSISKYVIEIHKEKPE
jgi:hypothetical protein